MKINITKNDYCLNLEKFMSLGNRENNSKRNFLFISKCLGKHLIVNPEVCRLTGYLLSQAIYQDKNIDTFKIRDLIENPYPNMNEVCKEIYKNKFTPEELTLVLGFAETATGLGMAVASAIKDSYYITTTREPIIDMKSCFDFEETHSHATSHQCFLNDINHLNVDRMILVDDEITTGNTMLNLIESLENNLPYKNRKYTVLSILDWRNEDQIKLYETFCKEHNVDIEVVSLISGYIENDDNTVYTSKENNQITEISDNIFYSCSLKNTYHNTINGKMKYIQNSGRFGVSEENIENLEESCKYIANGISTLLEKMEKKSNRVLVVGNGENIYIPSRIASYIENASFKTTSRSPIYISNDNNYPIKERHYFVNKDVTYYYYDKSFIEEQYDCVIYITEDKYCPKLSEKQISVIL